MRRKDRECNDTAFLDAVLEGAEVLYLALIDPSGQPYCLPVNFVRVGRQLYIHSALTGRKLDCIASHGEVAFSTAIDIAIDRARSTTYYKSICGRGIASIVTDPEEKGRALDALGARYAALCQRPAPQRDIRRVAIIRIDIHQLTGKRSLAPGAAN